MRAYVDFFYLTSETTPSRIEPSEKLMEEQKLNKQVKQTLDQTPEQLTEISDCLVRGEQFHREGQQSVRNCFKTYELMAQKYEQYRDYETASYFHQRCLDISIEFKFIEGEAKAHRGLGICEEKVFNKFAAQLSLETALEKAQNGELNDVALSLIHI